MAIIVAIAADHTREVHFRPALKRRLAGVPTGLAAALVIFVTGYWGLHISIYGMEGNTEAPPGERLTHTPKIRTAQRTLLRHEPSTVIVPTSAGYTMTLRCPVSSFTARR